MRILVTGSSGVIGTVLIPRLESLGEVIGLDITPPKVALDSAEYVLGSVTDHGLLSRTMSDCTHVIHLARGNPREWESLAETDINGSRLVLNQAAEQGIERVVLASSNNVTGHWEKELLLNGRDVDGSEFFGDPRPDSEYAVAKLFSENYGRFICETTNVAISCLRLGAVRAHDNPEMAADEPGFEWIPEGRKGIIERLRRTWLYHSDLHRIVEEELRSCERYRLRYAVSDNPGRYWPLNVVTV